MKKFTLACIAWLIILSAHAQINYLPGYVVTLAGDTTRGFIDYRNWKINPTSISFKNDLEAVATTYTPVQIATFSVADELYESGDVEIEVSPERINELSSEAEFKIERQTVYLQCLIRGNKNLYYLVNRIGKDNFYIKQGGQFELLPYKQYTRTVNYVRQVLTNNKYSGQLAVYLNDCASIQSKAANSRYLKGDLVKLFETYYQCKGQQPGFSKKADKIKVEFGALAGVVINSLNISSRSTLPATSADYDNSVNPTAGIYLTLVLPRNQGRFAIQNELLITSYSMKGEHLRYSTEDNYTQTDIELKATHLKLNTLARMKIPIGVTYLRLEAGMSNAFALNISAEQKQTSVFFGPPTTTESTALKTRKYEQGIAAGGGLDYKRFSFTTRYERGNGLAKGATIQTTFTRFYFMIGYQISK